MDVGMFRERFGIFPVVLLGSPVHGVGKSTVAKEFSKLTGWPVVSAGQIFRELAQERGMSVDEFSRLLAEDERLSKSVNREIEQAVISLVVERRKETPLVVDANLALAYDLPLSFKAIISAPLDVVGERALDSKKLAEAYYSRVEAIRKILARTVSDIVQYINMDEEFYIEGARLMLLLLSHYLAGTLDKMPYPVVENTGAPTAAARRLLSLVNEWINVKLVMGP